MKKKNSKKPVFKPGKILIVVVTLILISVSLFAYKNLRREYITATDSTGSFSYKYPDDWVIEPYAWVDCCEGPANTEPDWNKQSKPITLHPADDNKVIVTINSDKYGDIWKSFKELKASVKEDYFAKILFEGKRIDGHEALFSRVDYLGPPDAKVESFTDHRYYFDNEKSVVRVEFREKYHHDWSPENEIDYGKYKNDFEHIANSIKFLN